MSSTALSTRHQGSVAIIDYSPIDRRSSYEETFDETSVHSDAAKITLANFLSGDSAKNSVVKSHTSNIKASLHRTAEYNSVTLRSVEPSGFVPRATFLAEQEWQGEVVELQKHSFLAKLYDVTAPSSDFHEEAEFSLKEVSEFDLPLVKEGASFRWSLGYERSPAGTISKTAKLVFRRLPAWSNREIEASRKAAHELYGSIDWDDE